MGYYTYYSINVINANEVSRERLIAASKDLFHSLEGDDTYFDSDLYEHNPTINPFDWVSDDEMKWYECEDDMVKLSRDYPELVFEVEGQGEDRDDNWRAYFANGKFYLCRGYIYYEPAPDWAEDYL